MSQRLKNANGQTEKTYQYEYDSADYKADWKNTITSVSGTPIMETIKKGMEVQRKLDAFDRGDATREDMIAIYEDYARVSDKLFNMSREDFDKIYNRGNLQNKYEEFVNGSRSYTYAYHDAVAKAQLLKAGYPMDDVMELAQFYSYVQEAKRLNDLNGENKNPEVDARYDKMMGVWNNIVSGRVLTEEKRLENLRAVKASVKKLSDMVPSKTFQGTGFAGAETLNNLDGLITARENATLTLNQKIVMGGNAASMFKALDDADPGWMISSTEFKNMKEALLKFSKINKKADPGMYELYKNKVIDAVKNRDTKPSEIEAKLNTFIKHAERYEDTHNNMYGIGIGPVSGNGGTKIQKTATKKLDNLTKDGKSLTDYVLNGDQEKMYERLAEVKVYQEISRVTEKSPNLISRCLAADSNPNKMQVVNSLIKEQTELMKKMCPDPVSRRAEFESFVNKPGDYMLGRAINDANKKMQAVRQQGRMSARNKNVNKQNVKAKAVGPK